MLYTHLFTLVAALAAASPVHVPQKRDIPLIPGPGGSSDLVIDNASLGTPAAPEDNFSPMKEIGIQVTPRSSDCDMVKDEPSAWSLANQTSKSSTLVNKGTVLAHGLYNLTLYSDVVNLGGYTAHVTYPGHPQMSPTIGLGLHSVNYPEVTPPFFADAKELGFHVEREPFGASNKTDFGSLAVGGPHPDFFTGNITYSSVVNASKPGFNIPIGGVTINGETVARNDTGTISFDYSIFAPEEVVKKIYTNIPGASTTKLTLVPGMEGYPTPVDAYTMPCNPAPNVSVALHFAGQTYAIPAIDLVAGYVMNATSLPVQSTTDDTRPASEYTGMCVGVFQSSGKPDQWVVGRAFLANVYTVFRYDAPAVGFAQLNPSVVKNIASIPEPWTKNPKPSAARRIEAAAVVAALATTLAVLF